MFSKIYNFRKELATLDRTNGILTENGVRAFSPTHQSYILSSIKMFNQNKIFGIGPKILEYYVLMTYTKLLIWRGFNTAIKSAKTNRLGKYTVNMIKNF